MERFSRPGDFQTLSPSSTDYFDDSIGSSLDIDAVNDSVMSDTFR